jgi:hypothetical protein
LRARVLTLALLIFLSMATLLTTSSLAQVQGDEGKRTSYPTGSWGLGIVVPEGSQLEGGGRVSWRNASEITAIIQLPNITRTDFAILSVLSIMVDDGSVLQVAAGLYPNMSNWLAYGWFIQSPEADPQDYAWVLNSSRPEMAAGAWVSLSVYTSSSGWGYSVEDISTHEAVKGKFMFDVSPFAKIGDQEVFGFESYSYSNLVFEHMGSLVLSSLLINGRRVTKGWYYFADWDTSHNPLFVVGGLNPPPFIFTNELANGTVVWMYGQWTGRGRTIPPSLPQSALAVLPIVAAIAAATIILSIRKRRH